jgi:hypothetical protein
VTQNNIFKPACVLKHGNVLNDKICLRKHVAEVIKLTPNATEHDTYIIWLGLFADGAASAGEFGPSQNRVLFTCSQLISI